MIHFAFSSDPETIAFCENGKTAEILNLRTGKSIHLDAEDDQPGMSFSPDGKLLATAGYGTKAKVWSVSTGKLLRSLDVGPTQGGLTVAFSPDGKTLAVGNRNSTTGIFEVSTGKLLHTLEKLMSHELRFHPDSKTLAVAYVDGSIGLWNMADGKLLQMVKTTAQEIYTLDWSPNGEVLASAGLNSNITLWNPKDMTVLKESESPEWVISVRFSRDGSRLLTAGGTATPGGERKVQVWGLR